MKIVHRAIPLQIVNIPKSLNKLQFRLPGPPRIHTSSQAYFRPHRMSPVINIFFPLYPRSPSTFFTSQARPLDSNVSKVSISILSVDFFLSLSSLLTHVCL